MFELLAQLGSGMPEQVPPGDTHTHTHAVCLILTGSGKVRHLNYVYLGPRGKYLSLADDFRFNSDESQGFKKANGFTQGTLLLYLSIDCKREWEHRSMSRSVCWPVPLL